MTRKLAASVFVGSLLAAPIVAQSFASQPRYDRATETMVTGIIAGVDSFQTPDGGVGVHFDLQTPDRMVKIHVGPAAYIGGQNYSFLMDDKITVIGSRVWSDGNAAVWAKAIQKGSAMLILREDDGMPKWAPPIDGIDGCGVNHAPLPRSTER